MRFHLTDSGPRPCAATKRSCPMGGEHYSNLAEAEMAFAKMFSSQPLRREAMSFSAVVKPMAKGRYYGAEVPRENISFLLNSWHELLGTEAVELEQNKAARDRGYHYHLTVTSPQETKKLTPTVLATIPSEPRITQLGVGKAIEGENEAWFIVCESSELAKWREENSLIEKDFHITLGFKNKDVHSQPKDDSSLVL